MVPYVQLGEVITTAPLLISGMFRRLRASLKHEGYDQIPQLECPAAANKILSGNWGPL